MIKSILDDAASIQNTPSCSSRPEGITGIRKEEEGDNLTG